MKLRAQECLVSHAVQQLEASQEETYIHDNVKIKLERADSVME
jgi:hypothetical protein